MSWENANANVFSISYSKQDDTPKFLIYEEANKTLTQSICTSIFLSLNSSKVVVVIFSCSKLFVKEKSIFVWHVTQWYFLCSNIVWIDWLSYLPSLVPLRSKRNFTKQNNHHNIIANSYKTLFGSFVFLS